jgi:hypothetical protein
VWEAFQESVTSQPIQPTTSGEGKGEKLVKVVKKYRFAGEEQEYVHLHPLAYFAPTNQPAIHIEKLLKYSKRQKMRNAGLDTLIHQVYRPFRLLFSPLSLQLPQQSPPPPQHLSHQLPLRRHRPSHYRPSLYSANRPAPENPKRLWQPSPRLQQTKPQN